MRATPESPRMFESDFLDFFTRIPWWVVPLLYVPIVSALVAYGWWNLGITAPASAGAFALGWFVWTFTEYGLHRTLFHWVPRFRGGERMHFLLHGVHHDWPNDRYRLVMPPSVSLALFALFWGVWRLIAGPTWMFPIYGGFVFGYIVYDVGHYALHHFKPVGPFASDVFKRLKAHHMSHHFGHKPRKYGVSTTLWDHVFATFV